MIEAHIEGQATVFSFDRLSVMVCDAVKLNYYISEMLTLDPALFSDNELLTKSF